MTAAACATPLPWPEMLEHWAAQVQQHALLFLDLDGVCTAISPGARELFGFEAEDVVGQPLRMIFTEEDLALRLDQHEIAVAKAVGFAEDDRWHVRKGGVRFWASGLLTLLHGPDGEPLALVKTVRDRTDIKTQRRTQRNRLRAALAEHRRLKTFMLKSAHELANPLYTLKNASHLMGRPGTADRAELLAMVERQIGVMTRLVEDLRHGAGESHERGLVLERLSLHGLLSLITQGCRPWAATKQISLEFLAPPVDVEFPGDEHRLHQVFGNLIRNAVKYTPAGGQVWLKATVEPSAVVIVVQDTGVGVAQEMLSTIFDLFTQEDTSLPMAEGGMGIGLSVVRDLVRLHGGTIDVRSPGKDQGSVFTVRLPLADHGGTD